MLQPKRNENYFVSHHFFVCLFVCLEFIVPLENCLLIWRRHHCRWRPANFDLCSAFMAIEQWGFFNVPHLVRYGQTVYNGHLRGPVTLTTVPSVWQWICHYLFLRLRSVANGDRSPISRMRGKRLTSTPPRWSYLIVISVVPVEFNKNIFFILNILF